MAAPDARGGGRKLPFLWLWAGGPAEKAARTATERRFWRCEGRGARPQLCSGGAPLFRVRGRAPPRRAERRQKIAIFVAVGGAASGRGGTRRLQMPILALWEPGGAPLSGLGDRALLTDSHVLLGNAELRSKSHLRHKTGVFCPGVFLNSIQPAALSPRAGV